MVNAPPKKSWFLVRMEGTAPVVMQFRVLAENEDEAFKMVETRPDQIWPQGPPDVNMKHMQKRKVSIKNTLTGMINWVRNF